MPLDINYDDLIQLLKNFTLATGQRICIFDADGNEAASWPPGMCSFCTELRKNPDADRACQLSDIRGFELAREAGKAVIYQCHIGLFEATGPIVEDGKVIGYIMIGHILQSGSGQDYGKLILKRCAEYSMDLSTMTRLLSETPISSLERIKASMAIMTACAGYLILEHLIQERSLPAAARLKDYLDKNFNQPVTLDQLCYALNLGKTTLCRLAKDQLGMSIGDYLLRLRLNKAEQYLIKTDLPVYRVSELTGFSNQNYFSHQFKKHLGITPLDFRNRTSSENDRPIEGPLA